MAMEDYEMDAQQAIRESIARNRIVTLPWAERLAEDLLVESDDSAETDDGAVPATRISEYWGTTDDGYEWRVHLAQKEVQP